MCDSLSNRLINGQIGLKQVKYDSSWALPGFTAPYLTSRNLQHHIWPRAQFTCSSNSHSHSPCWGSGQSGVDLVEPSSDNRAHSSLYCPGFYRASSYPATLCRGQDSLMLQQYTCNRPQEATPLTCVLLFDQLASSSQRGCPPQTPPSNSLTLGGRQLPPSYCLIEGQAPPLRINPLSGPSPLYLAVRCDCSSDKASLSYNHTYPCSIWREHFVPLSSKCLQLLLLALSTSVLPSHSVTLLGLRALAIAKAALAKSCAVIQLLHQS